jgi:peptidoglycan/LPS O-acetylase OafA/YrhL
VSGAFLNACRGILAIIVCLAHTWQKILSPQYGNYGWDHAIFGLLARLAVVMFFVLSGWVIYHSLRINHEKNGRFDVIDWYMSRISRIIPPLAVSILITAMIFVVVRIGQFDRVDSPFGIVPFVYAYRPDHVLMSILSFGFLSNNLSGGVNGPLWSLELEMQLYLLACICFLAYGFNRVLAALILLAIAWRTSVDPNYFLSYLAFGFGFFASALSARRPKLDAHDIYLGYASVVIMTSAFVYMFYAFASDHHYLDQLAEWNSVFAQTILAFGFAMFLYKGVKLKFSAFESSGSYSYTLYIIHFPILIFLSYFVYSFYDFHQNVFYMVAAYFICASLCIYLARILGHKVERPKAFKAWLQSQVMRLRARMQ